MNLIKKHLILLVLFIGISTLVSAQNVEKIIAKHIEAHGGVEKWDAVFSLAIEGKFTAFSEEHPYYAIKSNKGEYYSEHNIGHHNLKEAFNGINGWSNDPWFEVPYPRGVSKVEINAFYQKAEFFTPLYMYKEKGHKVEYIGEENVDGIDTYVIKLTRTNGLWETWYLDKNTYLEYKSESMYTDFAMQTPCESYFEDFRNVDGLVIPFFIERMFGQRDHILVIEEIAINTFDYIDILEMPKSKQMEKLAFLAGDWNVKVEKLNRANALFTVDNTVSSFSFEADNLLKQNLSFDDYYKQSMILSYSYHNEKNTYMLTAFNEFSSTTDVLEGNFSEGVLTVNNVNVKIGDAEVVSTQISISEITDDAFVMEIFSSSDQGKTWRSAYKTTYSRK